MKRILIIATDGFEQSELMEPKKLLEEAGAEVTVASLDDGEIKGWKDKNWGDSVKVDLTVDEVAEGDYDALLLPGGQMNPDILRMNDTVIDLIKQFDGANKPIAAICHAPWLLAEAGIIDGKTVTGWPSIRTDLKNAGGEVVDKTVTVDGNLITSRNPDDIPAFTSTLMSALKMGEKLAENGQRIPENA
ncbi:type 1 glutamine amidotransferase domain-containing protein [Erythrobacter sp. THAF29]|uniref:type 1 glutamine amidotransferase domain-containing protein n=1 Tax=Erythrobacter sp. THAF29 TaxID=2587851 RepID=UPI001267A6ED|nr:type 1 glutamine amidotransferase domain-containing protein [Erythrobacter sp. THAF29]QFT77152.1 General stress protein 18 [Erythrobacter sp. THAF29]